MLNQARAAVYPAERVAKMEESRLKRFFLKGRGANAGQVRVRPEIADMVRYDTLNLLAPSWPINEKFDAIFCRNVMIYFDKPTQARSWSGSFPCSSRAACCSRAIRKTSPTSARISACAVRRSMNAGPGLGPPRRQKCRKSESCGRFRAGARPDDRDHQQPAGHGGRRDRARSAGGARTDQAPQPGCADAGRRNAAHGRAGLPES